MLERVEAAGFKMIAKPENQQGQARGHAMSDGMTLKFVKYEPKDHP